jgi:fimbrial chaperone protein/chaperone protein EcpD
MKTTLKPCKASRAALVFCAALLFPACDTHASVVVTGTRIVFAHEEQETTVRLTNKGTEPALVQAWVDSGDAAIDPNRAEAPFLVEPPISRIEPGKGQSIRLIHTGEPLAEDVESLFFFNILDVPPKPAQTQADQNSLQFALRTRIKLFLRPAGLRGTAAEAPSAVTWHIEQHGAGLRLVARNPTPYHVVLDRIEAVSRQGSVVDEEGGQISPRGEQSFRIQGLTGSPESWVRVRFMTINDHGGNTNGEAEIDTRPIAAS